MTFFDGITQRSIMTRMSTYVVVANTEATDVSSKVLPPSTLTRTNYPWHDEGTNMVSDIPLASKTGNFTLKANFGLVRSGTQRLGPLHMHVAV